MCFCKYEDHDVQCEDEIHHKILRDMFRKQRGLTKNGFNQIPEIKSELKLSDDVKSNFIQVPQVSSSQAVSWIFCITLHYSLSLYLWLALGEGRYGTNFPACYLTCFLISSKIVAGGFSFKMLHFRCWQNSESATDPLHFLVDCYLVPLFCHVRNGAF